MYALLPLHPNDEIELAALVEWLPFENDESQVVLCSSCSHAIPAASGANPVEQPDEERMAD